MESSRGDMERLRGIGQMSRESGLTVSALRFYDGAGVLVPARVDPSTGYRSYSPEQVAVARLVAMLRRVGMPLAGIRRVLAGRRDPAVVDVLLAEHLHHLEQGLADARRELSSVRSLLAAHTVPGRGGPTPEENPVPATTVTVRGPELAEALRAVRFAVGADPALPVLSGVLLDVTAEALTVVATDRYRLAVSSAPVLSLDGAPVAVVVPVEFADRIPHGEKVTIAVDGSTVTVHAGTDVLSTELIPDDFPDYRRLLPEQRRPVPVRPALRAELLAAPVRTMRREQDGTEFEVAVLGPGPDGGVTIDPDADGVGVNREFLLQALDAGGPGQLLLSLDGPIGPLVVRSERSVSLLMPVRL
ncbi:MerR family transcriptional regulator [Pseudonocardia xinjiangensis]|nr:MerR family transcriptional regulator [Pseudonocardia xinjiangensis]